MEKQVSDLQTQLKRETDKHAQLMRALEVIHMHMW
jgi:hypothetical protein